jgi:2-methylcitrate dehydratase
LWDLITGPFQLQPTPKQGGPYRAPETRLKYWPVEYNGQLPVWAALELRRHVDWRELTDVEIGVYTFCYSEIGSEPEKWDPKTRETADHSLPYIFAKVLVDGTITLAAFEESAYRDPTLRPLMSKIRVYLDREVDAIYPKTISVKIKAKTKSGAVVELWPRDPLGHVHKPMRDDDVKSKFLRTVEPVYGKQKTAPVCSNGGGTSKTPRRRR